MRTITRHDDGRDTWTCEQCGHEVARWPGQSDVDCGNCSPCYNREVNGCAMIGGPTLRATTTKSETLRVRDLAATQGSWTRVTRSHQWRSHPCLPAMTRHPD
jgi:hypothetical protein